MRRLLALLTACTTLAIPNADAQDAVAGIFASVNGTVISAVEYDGYAREAFRKKFFHGKPPEAEVNQMLREVGQSLIDQALLMGVVRDRQIKGDPATVAAEVARIDERNEKRDPTWKDRRAEVLPLVTAQIELTQSLMVLEKQVRAVTPTPAEVREFYQANIPLFTEPVRNKASLILIRVDPASPPEAWEEANKQAREIREKLLAGADFASLAREHSKDPSAAAGGDLGYLHGGMLSQAVEAALEGLQVGQVSEVVRALEGEVLLRLDGRDPSRVTPFESAEARAHALLVERRSNAQWKGYLEKLRAQANILVDPAFKRIMEAAPAPTTPPPALPAAQ